MSNKRSVTILELLIVIALMAAMAAIVVPLVADSLHERAFESAADVTSEQLVLARAHAQTSGEAVEVRYHAATAQIEARVEARLFSPWLPGFPAIAPWSASAKLSPKTPAAKNPLTSQEYDPDCLEQPASTQDAGAIAESWANRSLSRGIHIVNRSPAENRRGTSFNDASQTPPDKATVEQRANDDAASDIRLAVFMPDGSALMGAPVWFNDDDGRIGRLTINPWTGLPLFERLTDLGEDQAAASSAAAADVNGSTSAIVPSDRRSKAPVKTPAAAIGSASPGAAPASSAQ